MAFDAHTDHKQDDEALRRWPGKSIEFLDIPFHPVPLDALAPAIVARSKADAPFTFVVTPNVDHAVRIVPDPSLGEMYQEAWVNVCDSRILQLLASLEGIELPLAAGSDLTVELVRHHIDPREPLTVIGGDAQLIADLRSQFGFTDIHWHCPPMGLRRNPEAIEAAAAFIAASPARIHFLCVGTPQQEFVAMALTRRGRGHGVGLCVGASLEFLTGRSKRAPGWMQQLRLEWLFRLLSEPKRLWKRYLVDGPKVFGIWLRWRARRA